MSTFQMIFISSTFAAGCASRLVPVDDEVILLQTVSAHMAHSPISARSADASAATAATQQQSPPNDQIKLKDKFGKLLPLPPGIKEPCIERPAGLDPWPDRPVYPQDIARANFKEYVGEVFKDEQKKVIGRTNEMIERLMTAQQQELKREATVREAIAEKNMRNWQTATAQRSTITASVAQVINKVASKAFEAGVEHEKYEHYKKSVEKYWPEKTKSDNAARQGEQTVQDDRFTIDAATKAIAKAEKALQNATRWVAKESANVQNITQEVQDLTKEYMLANLSMYAAIQREFVEPAAKMQAMQQKYDMETKQLLETGENLGSRFENPEGWMKGVNTTS